MTHHLDHELESIREYPIRVVTYTRHGTPIQSTIYPHHEAKVLRAKGA